MKDIIGTATAAAAAALAFAFAPAPLSAAQSLEEGFANPPDSAKPHTWYHMMNGNVTKEGITCDFEALARVGIGGVQMFDAGCDIPPGPLKFNSDGWFDMFRPMRRRRRSGWDSRYASPTAQVGPARAVRGTLPPTR